MGSDPESRGPHESASRPPRSVTVVGAGGNIGSHLVPHLARMRDVGRIALIDPQSYEEPNITGQDIEAKNIGRPKAAVQGERVRRIEPGMRVDVFPARVEEVPPGALRADVILACLDSRRSRQYVNEIAWRLGTPWIDAGVDGGGLLARVNVYLPAPENPCLECGWGPRDYELVEQTYACSKGGPEQAVHPTRAPSHLGALAASLQAIECRKLLDGEFDPRFAGGEVLVDARHHNLYRTDVPRNPGCLMDHSVWPLGDAAHIPESAELGEALFSIPGLAARSDGPELEALGNRFVKSLTCASCGAGASVWRLERAIGERERTCGGCGGARFAAGSDFGERLPGDEVPATHLRRPLGEFGIREGDILRVSAGGLVRIVEVTG